MRLAAFDRIVLLIAAGLVAAIAGLAVIGDRSGTYPEISIVYLAGTTGQPQTVRVFALDSGETRDLLTSTSTILDFAPSPDGLQIALTLLGDGGKSDIWLIDSSSGKNRHTLGCAPSSCSSPAWSPNGRFLAYQRNEPTPNHASGFDRVWLYDLASGQTQPAFQDNQVLGSQPVWSFNGRRLAFLDDNASGIRVTDLVDQQAFLIPNPLGNDTGSFSADGNSLVFTKKTSENGRFGVHLWLAQLKKEPSFAPLLTGDELYQDNQPAWSPDGHWIAFLRISPDQPHQNQVMLYQPGASQVISLTGQDNYGGLTWDRTGKYLLVQRFLSNASATSEMWVYDFTAGRVGRRMIENGANGRWLP